MADALLTRDELKWLMDNGQIQSPEQFKKLAPPEIAMYNQLIKEQRGAGDPTSRRVDSNLMSGVPILGNVAPEDAIIGGQMASAGKATAGKALRGFADSSEGFWPGFKAAMRAVMEKPGAPEPNAPFSPENPLPWRMSAPAEAPEGIGLRPRGSAEGVSRLRSPDGSVSGGVRVPGVSPIYAGAGEGVGRGASKLDDIITPNTPGGGFSAFGPKMTLEEALDLTPNPRPNPRGYGTKPDGPFEAKAPAEGKQAARQAANKPTPDAGSEGYEREYPGSGPDVAAMRKKIRAQLRTPK